MNRKRMIAIVGFLAAIILSVVSLQPARAGDDDGFVKKGQELFKQNCASCHGLDAKGDGPAAAALKTMPADLTMIQEAGEKFPTYKVMNVIEGEKVLAAHGTREMPVWGTYFRRTKGEMREKGDIYSLMKYIESIQVHH